MTGKAYFNITADLSYLQLVPPSDYGTEVGGAIVVIFECVVKVKNQRWNCYVGDELLAITEPAGVSTTFPPVCQQ